MSETVNWRKHELECMRMATDCMQLAGDAHNPALQSHFVRLARIWSDLGGSRDQCGVLTERQADTQIRVESNRGIRLPRELRDGNCRRRCELAIICLLTA